MHSYFIRLSSIQPVAMAYFAHTKISRYVLILRCNISEYLSFGKYVVFIVELSHVSL